MKRSELQQIIREEISRVLHENSELDLTKPFGVVEKGGSIGSQANYLPRYQGRLIATFDTKEQAAAYARRRRAGLSAGERSYYKMTYIVIPTPKRM